MPKQDTLNIKYQMGNKKKNILVTFLPYNSYLQEARINYYPLNRTKIKTKDYEKWEHVDMTKNN